MGTQQAPLAVRKAKHGVDVSSHVLMAAIEEALEPGDETKLSSLILHFASHTISFSLIPRLEKLCI